MQTAFYNLIYWLALCLWALSEFAGAFRQRRATRRQEAASGDRGSYILMVSSLVIGVLVAGVVSGRVPAADLNWDQPLVVSVAALLVLLGIAFRQVAIRTLGRYFTNDVAVSADQPVVQSGPYRLIRHPAYTGTLITALGAGLGMTHWLGLVVILAGFLIGTLYRIRIEERALAATIGPPYVAYMQRTKRLIPFVF